MESQAELSGLTLSVHIVFLVDFYVCLVPVCPDTWPSLACSNTPGHLWAQAFAIERLHAMVPCRLVQMVVAHCLPVNMDGTSCVPSNYKINS
eukprot:759142-Pelagomonas_calceolata.AAC.3